LAQLAVAESQLAVAESQLAAAESVTKKSSIEQLGMLVVVKLFQSI